MDEVSFVDGKTRLFGIVGDPIVQVKSPEMVTYEMQKRGYHAILIPLHIEQADFERTMPEILRLQNLDGLIFTVPFKARAIQYAQQLGPQAQALGVINTLVKKSDGQWLGEMFDGMGCVESFRRKNIPLKGQRIMMMGLGGAGSAIAAAVAAEHPQSMRIFDLDAARYQRMKAIIQNISPAMHVSVGAPIVEGMDVLINATPVGMLEDTRMPIDVQQLPSSLSVFEIIVKPENTPLLKLALASGCQVIRGREMMQGQISRIVDFFFEKY